MRSHAEAHSSHSLELTMVGPLPPPAGGMANQTLQLVELLRSEGVQVELVQSNVPYRPAWIGSLRWIRALVRLIPYLAAVWRATARAPVVHVMANSGWSWHLMAAPAVWIASVRGKRVIVNYRGGDAQRFFSRSFWLVRPTLRRAAAVIVPSRFLADVFGRFGVRTHIVPNIVDLDSFRTSPRPGGDVHVIVTRNLEPIYDVGTAIRAFALVRARFPQARMTVAGTGPELQNLRALAAACGVADAVSFAGRIDNREIPSLYQSASLMLNPSTVDNMPISILEAWASGVPVVTTNVGGIPYLVEEGRDALLVNPGDPEAMSAAAVRILETPAVAAALAQRGREVASHYCWKQVRGKWLEVYESVASDRRVPGSEVVGG